MQLEYGHKVASFPSGNVKEVMVVAMPTPVEQLSPGSEVLPLQQALRTAAVLPNFATSCITALSMSGRNACFRMLLSRLSP